MSNKRTLIGTELVHMLTQAIASSSELWDPLKILPMRWQSLLQPLHKRSKQSVQDYRKENLLKTLSLRSLKKQSKSVLKETATAKNGKSKPRSEDSTSTKFSAKFTHSWRNSKASSKSWTSAQRRKQYHVPTLFNNATRKQSISNKRPWF